MYFRWTAHWDCSQHPHERSSKVAAILSVSVATIYGLNFLRQRRNRAKKVERKRRECKDAKETLQRHLVNTTSSDSLPEEITDLSFEELRTKLRNGNLDPVTVLRAYQKKALAVDQRLNCVIEPITEAEEWARDCQPGPLYGVPVSLKDIVPIKGYSVTFGGCANMLGMTHPMDSAIVTALKKRGAVPFMITNAPQTLLSFACTNPIFGFTGNPYNPERTPGGSSGGEGALIGSRGSMLGVGTDLGGSVRVPAAFCGICSLKPTSDRSSDLGFIPMANIVRPCNGPLARDVNTLVEYMRITCSPDIFDLDPATTPVPFREELYTGKGPLRVGYYCDDGYYPAIPVYHRAIREVKAILEKQGHIVVPFKVPDVGYAVEDLFLPAVFGDSGAMLKFILAGDDVIPDLVVPFWTLKLPPLARRVLAWIWGLCDRTQGAIVKSLCGVRSVSEWWKLSGAIKAYRTRVIGEWQAAKLDCMLCPPCASVALPDRVTGKLGTFYSYTALYNLLDFPAGVVPVTRVRPDDVTGLSEYVPQTHGQKVLKKAMVGSEGLPVGVQCVALPFQEEVALRMMKAIETGVRQA